MRILGCIFLFTLISFLSAAEDYHLFKEDGKFGLKNQTGQILIPAQYEALGWSNGAFSVIDRVTGYLHKGQWGLININDQKITKPYYTILLPTASEGFLLEAHKKIKNLVRTAAGCIDTSGKEVIPFEYDGIKIYTLRAIVFTRQGNQFKYGLIDLDNKKLIPLEFKEIKSVGSLRYSVENFQDKIALYAESGKQITDFMLDSLSSFYKNYAIIFQNHLQGLVDRDGVVKLQPTFSAIQIQPDGQIRVCQLNEWFFLDGQNNITQHLQCDSIEAIDNHLYKMNIAGVIRLVDHQFKPINNLTFQWLGKFLNGKAIFKISGKKIGLLRNDGTVAVDPKFDELIVDGTCVLGNQRQNGKDQWAVCDSLGNKKHAKVYEHINRFNGKFYGVKSRKSWGALNENGKEIIACVYDSLIQRLAENVVVKFHGQYGIIDMHEKWIVTPQSYELKLLDNDNYLQYTKQNTFLKSLTGNIIYFTENKIDVYPNYLLEHLPSGISWKIDLQGRIISRQAQPEEQFEKIFEESEGLRAIKKDGKLGFVDSRARLRIANRYEDVQHFSDQLAAIKILGKWGFIDHEDKIAIQPVYDEVTSFQKGVAVVKQKNLYGVIDKKGKIILPIRYTSIRVLKHYRMVVEVDDLFGLADVNGKLLISPKFDYLEDLNNGYVIVKRSQKYSLLTLQGISTIPMIYDDLAYDAFNDQYVAMKKAEWVTISL